MTRASTTVRAPAPPAWLVSVVAECLDVPRDEIDARVPLSRYGLDSLAAVELTAALASRLDRDLPDSLLLEHPDLEALARFLDGDAGAATPGAAIAEMLADSVLPPDIRPDPGRGVERGERAVLLTGVTGFLGAHLLRVLITQTRARVYCLVRPAGPIETGSRIRRALQAYGIWDPAFEARVEVVEGNLEQPRLGLSPARFEALGREIDRVYHSAAAVNWVYPYAGLREVNVGGTRELLRLACLGKVKPFHFVSTLAVCYSTCGPPTVSEGDDMLPHLRGIHLGYAQSKCVAEALVRQAAGRGLPARIYRPSFLSGAARSGVSNSDDFVSCLIKGCIQMGSAPDLDWVLDASPVDYVADAIVRLSRTGSDGFGVCHLENRAARHWRECVLWMNLFGYRIRLLPYRAWLGRLRAASEDPGYALRRLRGFFQARPVGAGGVTLPELYEASRRSRVLSEATDRALAEAGCLPAPPLSARLLDRYFTAFIDRGFLPAAARAGAARAASPGTDLGRAVLGSILGRFYGDPALSVSEAALVGGSAEHSILTELTSWRYGDASGLFRYRLRVASGNGRVPDPLEVMVKVKPADTAVLDVGESLARACGETVGRAYRQFRHRIGVAGCHVRELAIYEQADERFRRHAPTAYGALRDDARQAWILVLESLSDMLLMDTADDVSGWRRAHVGAAVRGLAELHAIWYGREAELRRQPWLGPVPSAEGMTEARPLWAALADHAAPSFESWIGPEVRRVQRALIPTVARWWRPLEAMPRTLVHNDFNPRNIALRRTPTGPRLCAYDWELATLGAPQHDLAELLCFVLTPDASRDEVLHYLDLHRAALARATGRAIDAAVWMQGFRLSLYDLLLNRLAMYALVHTFRRQRFLERVLRTWFTLYELFPDRAAPRRPSRRPRRAR